jgi:hypothetical protein
MFSAKWILFERISADFDGPDLFTGQKPATSGLADEANRCPLGERRRTAIRQRR